MDIQQLTQEMHHFVKSQGWYDPDSPRPQTARNLAISLNLEAGEVLELFQWGEEPIDQQAATPTSQASSLDPTSGRRGFARQIGLILRPGSVPFRRGVQSHHTSTDTNRKITTLTHSS